MHYFLFYQTKFLFVWLCEVERQVFTQMFLNICTQMGKELFENCLMFSEGRWDMSRIKQALCITHWNQADWQHPGGGDMYMHICSICFCNFLILSEGGGTTLLSLWYFPTFAGGIKVGVFHKGCRILWKVKNDWWLEWFRESESFESLVYRSSVRSIRDDLP